MQLIFLLVQIGICLTRICQGRNNPISAPVDFVLINDSERVNLSLYFLKQNSIDVKTQLKFHDTYLGLYGDYGKINVDENVNGMMNEYKCSEIRMAYPSFNRFWKGNHSSFEILIKCNITPDWNKTDLGYVKETIVLTFPVEQLETTNVELFSSLEEYFSRFIEIKEKEQINKLITSDYILRKFDLNKFFFGESKEDIKQFYFYNANDVIDCTENDVTWIVFKSFLKINKDSLNFFENFFENLNVSNAKSTEDYYKHNLPWPNIKIFRNFAINEEYLPFESVLLQKSNLASYLKVYSKIFFVILIIILYD